VPVLLKHPRAAQLRHLAPGMLALALIGGLLLAPFSRAARRLWLTLLVAYTTALATGMLAGGRGAEDGHGGAALQGRVYGGSSVAARDLGPLDGGSARPDTRRDDAPERWRLPPAFACMHLGYGCGFLASTAEWLSHELISGRD
jgi:hypothetical protein